MTEMTTPWAGDAMDTLKMKIGLITKESKESSTKMEKAEKVCLYIIPLHLRVFFAFGHLLLVNTFGSASSFT